MNRFESDFVYGRDMVKKLIVASVLACIVTLFTQSTVQLIFIGITAACFVAAIFMVYKYCRCPSCGKVIFFGLMALKQCPRCRRNLVTGQKMKKAKR